MVANVFRSPAWLKRFMERVGSAPEEAPTTEVVPWGGEQVDVDHFWAEAWQELKLRQAQLTQDLKLENAEWVANQESGLIEFSRQDGAIVRAPVQIIGSWNPAKEQFVWAWDHAYVHPRLRADAERTRWFGDAHALHDLTANRVPATESEAWRLAAVAMKVNASTGVYRAPTDGPVVFMNMGAASVVFDPKKVEQSK